MKKYGLHVEIPKKKGVLINTPLTAMAFFLGSSHSWRTPTWSEKQINNFIKTLNLCKNLDSDSIVVHGCYLMNPASLREDVVEKTKIRFIEELQLCESLSANNYVFHPGTCKDTQKGLQKTIDLVNLGLSKTKRVNILVENMTKTNSLGQTWEELDFVIRHLNNSRVGCCLDTAHCWGAGPQKKMFMDTLLDDFDKIIGINHLKAIHLNDSKVSYGSNKDRHEDILVGQIPKTFWKGFICDRRVENIPTILETPSNCRDVITKIINGKINFHNEEKIDFNFRYSYVSGQNKKMSGNQVKKQLKINNFFLKNNVNKKFKESCSTSKTEIINYENMEKLLPIKWRIALKDELEQKYFKNIKKTLQQYHNKSNIFFPPLEKTFNAFKIEPLKINVVILGQDPYHGTGQAEGLSFSVPENMEIPSSLKNIFKELKSDLNDFEIPDNGNLQKWVKQGVFLLNTTLTVFKSNAGSHSKLGWSHFTDSVINYINLRCENVVFMLWGSHAKKKAEMINPRKHLILESAHPSGLSAHRGFFGCKHFSKCNNYLVENGKTPIKW